MAGTEALNSAAQTGRVALVTGAAKNIGRAIALALAGDGVAVMLSARADAEGLAETARLIEAAGGQAAWRTCDVTDEAAVAELMAATLARFGRLDVLVNNAAIRNEIPFEAMTLADFRAVTAVALEGPFLLCRAALAALTASGQGSIVNIGGLSAYAGAKDRAHVIAAKAGLDGLTKALAHDLAPRAITVNLVSPGLIETKRADGEPAHHRARTTLVGRHGTPAEVAAMVRFLASPEARYVTGQTLHVNGGAYLP